MTKPGTAEFTSLLSLQDMKTYLLKFSCIVILLTAVSSPAGTSTEDTVQHSRSGSDPYCGIHCLYVAAKLYGLNINSSQLIKPEYIGSVHGSSLAELKKAAEDIGLYAELVGNLTERELSRCPYPVILHAKSSLENRQYGHYRLFLKTENRHAKLFNPPGSLELLPWYKLVCLWDGNGLIVSDKPIDLKAVFAPAYKKFVVSAVAVISIVLLVRFVRWRWFVFPQRKFQRLLVSAIQAAGLLVFGGFLVIKKVNNTNYYILFLFTNGRIDR